MVRRMTSVRSSLSGRRWLGGWILAVAACASPPRAAEPQAPQPAPSAEADRVAGAEAASGRPGPAKIEEVTEVLHGVTVRDPYRWMEKGGAAFDAFLDEQNRHARAVLAAIPGRDQLRDQLHAANRGVARVGVLGLRGPAARPRVFLLKRQPEDSTSQLYVRDGFDGQDRLLVDPRGRDRGEVHYSIDYAVPSPDGKHVAYGISASGSEDSVIEILKVDGGQVLAEKIDRAQYASIDWRDDRSFFYWRRRAPAPTDTPADWFKNSATYLHVLGDDPERARPLISPAMPGLGLAPEVFTWLTVSGKSRWTLAAATPGTSADLQYFIAPTNQVLPDKTPWRRLSTQTDKVGVMVARGDTIYATSYDGAPRYRVISFDARTGSLATAKVLVPENEHILDGIYPADDGLYLLYFDGGKNRLERISYDGKKREVVKLPVEGTLSPQYEDERPGLLLYAESWARPPRDLWLDARGGVRELALREAWPVDYSNLVEELVEVPASDGAKVPMSIIRRKDTPLDGSAPALLNGYQAYGGVEQPFFAPIPLVWVERGGVRANCHGRGTGNRGKAWHTAGIKQFKERGVDDFLACAEYLVAKKYTSAARLTATGTSAGGVLVGGALTKRPELFAAAFLRVPVTNLLRIEQTEGGLANIPENGTPADKVGFESILASDPYYRLEQGKRYPALIVTGGRHDVRVPVWMPAKFVARAQALRRGDGGDGGGDDRPILFRVENSGHGRGSTTAQFEEEWADLYAFALWQSGVAIEP